MLSVTFSALLLIPGSGRLCHSGQQIEHRCARETRASAARTGSIWAVLPRQRLLWASIDHSARRVHKHAGPGCQ